MASPTMEVCSTFSRSDLDVPGADPLGFGAVDAAVAGRAVGFATPTDALAPCSEFASIPLGKMGNPGWECQLGWGLSSFLPLDVMVDTDWASITAGRIMRRTSRAPASVTDVRLPGLLQYIPGCFIWVSVKLREGP